MYYSKMTYAAGQDRRAAVSGVPALIGSGTWGQGRSD